MSDACPLPLPNGLDRETNMPSLRHVQPNRIPLRIVRIPTNAVTGDFGRVKFSSNCRLVNCRRMSSDLKTSKACSTVGWVP